MSLRPRPPLSSAALGFLFIPSAALPLRYLPFFLEASFNLVDPQCTGPEEGEEPARHPVSQFDFPVAVMNLEHRKDRKVHSGRLLSSLAFRNVTFPKTLAARELDLESLVASGEVGTECAERISRDEGKGPASVAPYVAHALSQVMQIREFLTSGHLIFGIFEDDLMAYQPLSTTRKAIELGVSQLPPSADLLFLDGCHEDCSKLRYSTLTPNLVRLHAPYCTGAMVFTRSGAVKVLRLINPIFGPYDDMLHDLILSGDLEAYAVTPLPFFQDGYWNSECHRVHNTPGQLQSLGERRSIIVAPFCGQIPQLEVVQAGHAIKRQLLETWALHDLLDLNDYPVSSNSDALFVILSSDPGNISFPSNPRQASVLGLKVPEERTLEFWGRRYVPGGISHEFIQKVGLWKRRSHQVVLQLDSECECFHTLTEVPLCTLESISVSSEGEDLATIRTQVYIKV
mmetsp:Transcript_8882/g.14038  ORF Transcript_8882/g.14038 Transcript_8882/m.14038 type:complete len:456 (-) Transcript_8882:862-2229(-)